MGRQANPDIRRAFVEFNDEETPSKCNKVRCVHCGFVRAKNTTRQIEHLQSCKEYLNSPAAQEGAQLEPGADTSNGNNGNTNGGVEIFNGTRPNPNLHVQRRGPNSNKRKSDQALSSAPTPSPSLSRTSIPLLTTQFLTRYNDAITAATQPPILSHAGCGTLSSAALSEWLTQDSHYARGYITFIGALIAKVRLPFTQNTQFHVLYRTLDLLISALNNVRREMSFFEITATKYNLGITDAPPTPVCRAYLDLFQAAASPGTSLLEGLVVLWATEHCYRAAWTYAASCSSADAVTMPPPPASSNETHLLALHHALIPNWTSPAFSKFVDASRGLVDELAAEGEGWTGRDTVSRCEDHFQHVLWLEERFWPVVDGQGEQRNGHEERDSRVNGVGEGEGEGEGES